MPDRMGHAHAGQVENDLNNDRAADKVANAKAKNGNGRNKGIAQHVAANNDTLRNAGAKRGAHVVFIEFFDHRGANNTSELASDGNSQCDSGHRHAGEPASRVLRKAGQRTGCWQHMQHRREQQDHENRQPERGRSDSRD